MDNSAAIRWKECQNFRDYPEGLGWRVLEWAAPILLGLAAVGGGIGLYYLYPYTNHICQNSDSIWAKIGIGIAAFSATSGVVEGIVFFCIGMSSKEGVLYFGNELTMEDLNGLKKEKDLNNVLKILGFHRDRRGESLGSLVRKGLMTVEIARNIDRITVNYARAKEKLKTLEAELPKKASQPPRDPETLKAKTMGDIAYKQQAREEYPGKLEKYQAELAAFDAAKDAFVKREDVIQLQKDMEKATEEWSQLNFELPHSSELR